MSYTIEKLPGEPIMVSTGHSDFSGDEGPKLVEDMANALDGMSEPVYLISDMAAITLGIDDVLQGSNMMSARGQKPVFAHTNVIANVFVTSNNLFKLAAKGLSAPIFGGLHIKVVDSVDEALSYCRQMISSS